MDGNGTKRRIAIACQGGGSHTAFTAGALRRLLTRERDEYESWPSRTPLVGHPCPVGLVRSAARGRDEAARLLTNFWTRDNSANTIPERLLNDWIVDSVRVHQETGFLVVQSPNVFSDLAQDELRRAVERNVRFDRIDGRLVGPESPKLFVGAVDVITGGLKVFRSHWREETERRPCGLQTSRMCIIRS